MSIQIVNCICLPIAARIREVRNDFFFMQKFHVPQVTSKNKQLYVAFVNVYPKLYGRRQSEV